MNSQNLIIFKYVSLYHILNEIGSELNFKVFFADSIDNLNKKIKNLDNYLIVSNEKKLILDNHFFLENKPMRVLGLVEKINIEFLKLQFNTQSEFKINKYKINLNSREMFIKNIKLKLTEKEINTIIYLSKSNKPVSINELQEKVWSYQSDIETHTVETHNYRLRKKILKTFSDNELIISRKNGYEIKKEKSID